MTHPRRFELERPGEFLAWIEAAPPVLSLDDVDVAQAWALVGLAALARPEQESALELQSTGASRASRFARAIGVHAARNGTAHVGHVEQGRTVPARRFRHLGEVELVAGEILPLLLGEGRHEETRLAIHYVLVELLRNVVQHSGDALGGVVAAQTMLAGRGGYEADTVQVAVADTGMGIPTSLSGTRPEAADPRVALELALQPHVSGAFLPGYSGSGENAGLGLFFIAEMAKLTAGRLLVASRGASLLLRGDEEAGAPRQDIQPFGFPGTLVAFELALDEVKDFDRLIEVIQNLARQRAATGVPAGVLRFVEAATEGRPVVIAVAVENTEAARALASRIEEKILNREEVVLDFRNLRTCTQSFLHALLFDVIRLAWARRSHVAVIHAAPAVRSALTYLESYALRR